MGDVGSCKVVHVTIVVGTMRAIPSMTKIGLLINGGIQRNRLDDPVNFDLASCCSVRSWKQAEIVVERVIFFGHKNDMLDTRLCVCRFIGIGCKVQKSCTYNEKHQNNTQIA